MQILFYIAYLGGSRCFKLAALSALCFAPSQRRCGNTVTILARELACLRNITNRAVERHLSVMVICRRNISVKYSVPTDRQPDTHIHWRVPPLRGHGVRNKNTNDQKINIIQNLTAAATDDLRSDEAAASAMETSQHMTAQEHEGAIARVACADAVGPLHLGVRSSPCASRSHSVVWRRLERSSGHRSV